MQLAKKAVVVAALATALVAATPVPAHAGPPGTPSRHGGQIQEGLELAKAGKTEQALQKFEEAYSIVPSGTAAYQIARMEQSLERHALALQHYREALRDPKLATDARRESEKAVELLQTKIGIITLEVPEGSSTTVDGNEVDAKKPVEVVPGLHIVKIRLGGETKSSDVTAVAGAVTPVKLRFGEDPKPTPATPPPATTEPPKREATRWPTSKLVTVGAGAVVSAGLLTASAIVFASADDTKAPTPSSCADPRVTGCAGYAEARDSYDGARTTSTILFYGGLVLGVATVAAAVLWPNDRVTTSASFSPRTRLSATTLTIRF